MSVSRREALALGGGLLALGGCRPTLRLLAGDELPAQMAPIGGDSSPEWRTMNRFAFGPRPGDLEAMRAMGRTAWIEAQLEGSADEPAHLTLELSRLDVLRVDAKELEDIRQEEAIRQLQQAQLLTAIYSNNQLRERMVDFWTNHFNIYAKKPDAAFRMGTDERDVIRKHALGSFPEMLRASARSPAMLGYLDNTLNKKGVPNENYAREILELHSLGVHGGYTQRDIQELARCLSGFTIEHRWMRPNGRLRFIPEEHDDGAKRLLGRRIPAGLGERDLDVALDIIVTRPATAQFLAQKLALYFLGRRDAQIEAEVAQAYQQSNGSIQAMLRPIALSDAALEAPPMMKRPFDFIVSTLRATDADTRAHHRLTEWLRRMGQPGHEWPMPDGYPLETEAWTGSLLARWNFVEACFSGGEAEARPRLSAIRERFKGSELELLDTLFGARSHPESKALVAKALRSNGLEAAAALCCASPEFQWR